MGTLDDPTPPSASPTSTTSTTAHAVAAGRAIGYGDLHDPLAQAFLPGPERAIVRRARALARRTVGADAVAVATAGVSRHAALRMHAVDRAVTAAVGATCRQVVVLGAGYDTRAWRLPALAELPVVEVDLPATQRAKRARLDDPGRVVFVEADLAEATVPDVLAPTTFDPSTPTCWVWEAVAPYLPGDAVAGVLEGIRAVSAPGSTLVMTFAHPDLLGPRGPARIIRPATGFLAGLAFRILGEPILSTYDEWDVCALLTHHGFDSPEVTDATRWARDAGLSARPDPLRAEMLVVAAVVDDDGGLD